MKIRFNNKIVSAVLASLIAIIVLLPVFGMSSVLALNPNGVDPFAVGNITIEADPPRLSSAGYVTITIKLRNTNPVSTNDSIGFIPDNYDPLPTPTPDPAEETPEPTNEPIESQPPISRVGAYTNISIVNSYGVSFSTYDVAAGQTGTFRGSMMVSESQIGTPLSFTIYWHDTAVDINYVQNLSITIQRSDTAYLRLTRTASVSNAAIGEPVEFTYTMVNTGTRRLTNITLVDEKIGGNTPLTSAFSLASGEKKEVIYTYTMQGASVVSKPVATFTPDGSSTALSVTVSKLTIGLINAQLSKNVTVGNSTPEGVNFTLFLTNNGSQNLSDLTVKNDLGDILASGFSLAIGESRIIEHFVPNPVNVRNVFFEITGSYASGKEFHDNTTSYTVRPYIDPNSLGLKFTAEIIKQLNAENHLVIKFNVANTGRVPYTNVVLTEKELGYNLHEIETLEPSRTGETFNVDVTIDGPREMVFYLTAVDPSGNTYQYEAIVNAEYVDLQSAIPNETPDPGNESGMTIIDIDVEKQIGERGQQLMRWWKTLEVIFFATLAVILVLGGIEAWLYFSKKKAEKN